MDTALSPPIVGFPVLLARPIQIAAALLLIATTPAASQGNCYDPIGGNYAHGDIEIGLYIHNDNDIVNVKIYDGETGILVPGSAFQARGDSRLLSPTRGCSWTANVGQGGPGLITLQDSTKYVIELDGDFLYRFDYYLCNTGRNTDPIESSFYCPQPGGVGDDSGGPDMMFIVTEEGDIEVVTRWTDSGDHPLVQEHGHDRFVLPYDGYEFCTPSCVGSPSAGLRNIPFLALNTTNGTTFSPSYEIWENWEVPNGEDWKWSTADSLGAPKLMFRPSRTLAIDGNLDLTSMTLTAADTTQGWGGVRFEPGSGGSLIGTTATPMIIEKVNGSWGTSSLSITDASPILDKVIVRDPVGSGVRGIKISGSNAYSNYQYPVPGQTDRPTMNEVTVRDMKLDGLWLNNQATARLTSNSFTNNDWRGITAGYQTEAFLYPNLYGDPKKGNTITGNGVGGLLTTSGAGLTFGHYYNMATGYSTHNKGFNQVIDNPGNGLTVIGGSATYAGSSTGSHGYHSHNSFYGNAVTSSSGKDAIASGTASRFYARCNWWQDTTPPFRTSEGSGGVVYDDYWLMQNPQTTQGTSVPCTHVSSGARQASVEVSGPSAWLLEGVAAEDPEVALAHFQRVLSEAPESGEAAVALAEIGRLAERRGAPETARALLEHEARGKSQRLRSVATRGLIGVHLSEGDPESALVLADGLVLDVADDAQALRLAQTERVYLLATLGRYGDAQAALALAEAQGTSVETDLAREALGLEPRQTQPRRGVGPEARGEEPAQTPALVPSPNPARDAVTMPLALDAEATIRLTVYDALGREVGGGIEKRFSAGEHAWWMSVAHLPAGVYLAQAEVLAEGAAPRILRGRLTVAR